MAGKASVCLVLSVTLILRLQRAKMIPRMGSKLTILIAVFAIACFPGPSIEIAAAQPMPEPSDCKYAPGPSASINAYCDGYSGRAACVFGEYIRYCLEGRNRGESGKGEQAAPPQVSPSPDVSMRERSAPHSYPSIDPNSELGKGIALYRGGDLQEALPLLKSATLSDPTDPRGFAYLAAALHMLGLRAEADTAHQRAIALDPKIMNIVK